MRMRLVETWRRELPPVLVVGALAFDYLSPAALWTIVPPLLCVLAMMLLRRWGAGALVIVLSSWVAIPAAARVSSGLDAARGTYRVYEIPMAGIPAVDEATFERCFDGRVQRDVFDAGAALARRNTYVWRVARTFFEWHNDFTMTRAARQGWRCGEAEADQWVVLPDAEVDRTRPADLEGQWTPDSRDVERADDALAVAIDAAFIEIGGDWRYSPRPAHFHRQYRGYYRDGARVLHINGIPHDPASSFGGRLIDGWRRKLNTAFAHVGSYQAIYDIERGAIDSLQLDVSPYAEPR
jgi:hypothetical protein